MSGDKVIFDTANKTLSFMRNSEQLYFKRGSFGNDDKISLLNADVSIVIETITYSTGLSAQKIDDDYTSNTSIMTWILTHPLTTPY